MALDHFDRLAEASVKEAIQQLVANAKRPDSRSVPPEARALLLRKSRSRLTEPDAAKKVEQAIQRLRDRKEIKAPSSRYTEWALFGDDTAAAETAD
jgi:hypothetical protein